MYKKNDIVVYKPTPQSKGIRIKILIHKDDFLSFGSLPTENYDYYVRSLEDGKQFFIKESAIVKQ